MKIVLDTNVLLVSVSPRSQFYPIYRAFLEERYLLCVTTDILLEYEEILTDHVGPELTDAVLQTIRNAPNTLFVTRYFEWELIKADPDDNKFVDCCVAIDGKYIVTEDGHFKVLKQIPFPSVATKRMKPFMREDLGIPVE